MGWKIRMMSGTVYEIGKEEAENATKAMVAGGMVSIPGAILNGKSIEAVEDGLSSNPIIQDENFKGLLSGEGRAIDLLNNRYSGDRHSKNWEEALKYKRVLEERSLE